MVEKKQKDPETLVWEAQEQMRARETWSPGFIEAVDYINQIAAAWKFFKAGDIESATTKFAVCLKLQNKRLLEGLVILADNDLFKLVDELESPSREESDPLRQLLESN